MKTPFPADHAERLDRAKLALEGLSVGDALGETCFLHRNYDLILDDPFVTEDGPWPWTDDTAMAISIYEVLAEAGHIDQDLLAERFAQRFDDEPARGYGQGAFKLLNQIHNGLPWREVVREIFPGGSYGNGSAMRIAPLAGYFADDDYEVIAQQAALSAEVTHAHAEGIAGAVATAIAGGYAWRHREQRADPQVQWGLMETVIAHTPESDVRTLIKAASTYAFQRSTGEAEWHVLTGIGKELGNGSRISCQDTVPFCIWAAARHLDNYQDAIIAAITVRGDIDTNCAIVGGIVSLATGAEGIPDAWWQDREPLPC